MNEADNSGDIPRLTPWELIRQVYRFVIDHELETRATAIAFGGLMAAVPFLAMLLTVCVQLLPDLTPGGTSTGIASLTVEQLQSVLISIFPNDAYRIIEELIRQIQGRSGATLISISAAVALWCSSSVFMRIIDALNHIYGVKETRPYWRLRIRAMIMTVIQMVIVTTALLSIIFWPTFAHYVGIDTEGWLNTIVGWALPFTVILVSFALMFHMGPDVAQRHRWVTPGSVFGTVCFLSTCYLVRLYVQNFAHYEQVYGSLAGGMALLLWFYITSLVVLIAAELNRVVDYATKRCAEHRTARANAKVRAKAEAEQPSSPAPASPTPDPTAKSEMRQSPEQPPSTKGPTPNPGEIEDNCGD